MADTLNNWHRRSRRRSPWPPCRRRSITDIGEDLIEGADEIVEAITEELPGGGVVNQVWDVVLAAGRFGIRVATTVLNRGEPG